MTGLDFYNASVHLQGFSSLCIFLIAVALAGLPYTKEVKIFVVYGFISFLFYLGQMVSPVQYINPIGDFFVLFETSIFFFLYYTVSSSKWKKVPVMVASAGFYVVFLSYLLSEEKGLGASIRSYRDLGLIIFSITYFAWLLNNLTQQKLSKLPMFWINSAILFFFSCTFILSLSMSYIAVAFRDDFALFWAFRNFLRVGFCLVICLGIWKARKLPSQPQPRNTIS